MPYTPKQTQQLADRYLAPIQGRMANDATGTTDAEVRAALGPCVGGERLVQWGLALRDAGYDIYPAAMVERVKRSRQ